MSTDTETREPIITIGAVIEFEDGPLGIVTGENEEAFFVKSDLFTGWIPKACFTEAQP